MDIEITPEWIRSLIPTTVFVRDRENYRIIADALEALVIKIAQKNTNA